MNRALTLTGLLVLASGAHAADGQGTDSSRIEGRAGANVSGAVGVNVAAGVGNVQANERAIASGTSGLSFVTARQRTDAAQGDRSRAASAVMGDSAFSGTRGVVGINQAAGGGNAQLNVLAIGAGADTGLSVIQQVDNAALAATAAPARSSGAGPGPQQPLREARIDAGALRDSQGVLQVNQSAGVGNASVNAVVLQLPGGGR